MGQVSEWVWGRPKVKKREGVLKNSGGLDNKMQVTILSNLLRGSKAGGSLEKSGCSKIYMFFAALPGKTFRVHYLV